MSAVTAIKYQSLRDQPTTPSSRERAMQILGMVMQHRRLATDSEVCAHERCAACAAQHVQQLQSAIERNEPVHFVLPAFPGKSPNLAKVLGTRADMAEEQSLTFLNSICDQIKKIYAPGARIILCSDGRVFSDVVGIKETDISAYHEDLVHLITKLGMKNLATFNLDDVFPGSHFDAMRSKLMSGYGDPVETLQDEVRAGGDALRLYRGITRFLFEDGLHPDLTISKTALQKECRQRAYQVIQRSRAWDDLLAHYFPNAVRLSIHPQACGSRKIGIHLMETTDQWLTPWHGVAVEAGGRFQLMKHDHAKRLGGELVLRDGRPSHYMVKALPQEV